jgi:RNA-directed DNA polymerase
MFTNTGLWTSVATSLISSKESANDHKTNLRKIIKKHKGVSQENLIYNLNPIIRDWALSKRTQISSKDFSEMDKFIYLHLWNWARKRHPNMAHTKIKDKYWNIVGNSKWVFGTKTKQIETGGTKVSLRLQKHSEIRLQKAYPSSRSFSPYVQKCDLLDNNNGCTHFTTSIY